MQGKDKGANGSGKFCIGSQGSFQGQREIHSQPHKKTDRMLFIGGTRRSTVFFLCKRDGFGHQLSYLSDDGFDAAIFLCGSL